MNVKIKNRSIYIKFDSLLPRSLGLNASKNDKQKFIEENKRLNNELRFAFTEFYNNNSLVLNELFKGSNAWFIFKNNFKGIRQIRDNDNTYISGVINTIIKSSYLLPDDGIEFVSIAIKSHYDNSIEKAYSELWIVPAAELDISFFTT